MALHQTGWICLSFVLAFCLIKSTQSLVLREKASDDSAQNWGLCNRYACGAGKRKAEPKISQKPLKENKFNKPATYGDPSDRKASKFDADALQMPCFRFGCRKRRFLVGLSTGSKILDARVMSPGKQRPFQEAIQQGQEAGERKSRCFQFGCKKSFDRSVTRNKQKKTFSDTMKNLSTIPCHRFSCYVKKNEELVQRKKRQESNKAIRKRLSDAIFHKDNFQENDNTK